MKLSNVLRNCVCVLLLVISAVACPCRRHTSDVKQARCVFVVTLATATLHRGIDLYGIPRLEAVAVRR